jgi:hypothetical protein
MAKLHSVDEPIFSVEISMSTDIGAIIIAIDKMAWPFTICFGHQSDWIKLS